MAPVGTERLRRRVGAGRRCAESAAASYGLLTFRVEFVLGVSSITTRLYVVRSTLCFRRCKRMAFLLGDTKKCSNNASMISRHHLASHDSIG